MAFTESTLATYETSRKKLGVDYIDLYLIHWAVTDTYKETPYNKKTQEHHLLMRLAFPHPYEIDCDS